MEREWAVLFNLLLFHSGEQGDGWGVSTRSSGEAGPSAGEVRTPRGERVHGDAQRGKGRGKG